MIKIFTNVITRKCYDANGDLFRDGVPNIFYNATDTVMWQLCTATPDIARESGETPETAWTKCTDYADYAAIGAFLTADNDYIKRIQGVLTANVSSGEVSSVSANVPDAGLDTIPKEGTITLLDAAGHMEVIEYDDVDINGEACVFSITEGTELEYSYDSGNLMDVCQEVLMQATLDTALSDVANGLFVFQPYAYSRKLHDLVAYANIKQADVMGLELAIFDIDTENSVITDLERFELDSFTILTGMADTSMDAQVSTQKQNQMVSLMTTLLASGFQVQFSSDNANWHDEQSTTAPFDMFFRFRNEAVGGEWTQGIMLPSSSTAMVWAEGSDQDIAALGGTHSAKGWAQIALNGVTIPLVASTDATLSPVAGNAYVWTVAQNSVIEFSPLDISGKYVEIPIYISPSNGVTISGSTASGKAVELAQPVTGEGWYLLAWNGTKATLFSYTSIPVIDGGCIDS